MNLFEMKDYKLQIHPEAYGLQPFKKILDRDKSKDKKIALEELSYIYFMTDYTSDFMNIIDEKERNKEVIKSTITIKDWKPDKDVEEALKFYEERQYTIKLGLLWDARHGISKLSHYLRDINFEENEINDKTGEVKPKHDIKKYADTIKQIPGILEALDTLEEAVKKERDVQKGLRGGREKGMYAD